MAQVAAGVLRGEVDPRVANSSAYVCSTLLKATEITELERRVEALEQAIDPKQARR